MYYILTSVSEYNYMHSRQANNLRPKCLVVLRQLVDGLVVSVENILAVFFFLDSTLLTEDSERFVETKSTYFYICELNSGKLCHLRFF